jgi:hypothetical protein
MKLKGMYVYILVVQLYVCCLTTCQLHNFRTLDLFSHVGLRARARKWIIRRWLAYSTEIAHKTRFKMGWLWLGSGRAAPVFYMLEISNHAGSVSVRFGTKP